MIALYRKKYVVPLNVLAVFICVCILCLSASFLAGLKIHVHRQIMF